MAAAPTAKYRWPKAMRLRDRREITQLRSHGKRMVLGCLIANWQLLPPDQSARLGVITHRGLGNAVKRARARRLLREAFRLHQHDLTRPIALVLVARRSITDQPLAVVENDYLSVLKRHGLIKPDERL